MGKAENAVTRAVKDYLTLHGAVLVRVQAGGMRVGDHFVRGADAGTADMLGIWKERPFAVEVKTTKNKAGPRKNGQSEAQIGFQAWWEAAGGVYLLARSVEDAEWFVQDYK
jgi:penicillin-binding protein-related factor A (putative recombinase)